ncbi:MAG: PKD domain-containing protein [Phycisphaerae bacterium]
MELTDRDKEIIKDCIDRGEPLPAKYKLMLFADAPDVELICQGKTGEVTNAVLPFQTIEQIDEPRRQAERQVDNLFSADPRGREREIWTGNYIFENEWQTYRTRKDRKLECVSGKHSYSQPGRYKIAVKVIDIFGNDTTKVVEVKV